MNLDIVSYNDLLNQPDSTARQNLENALLQKGIVGIRYVPNFVAKSQAFIDAARQFAALPANIKQQYAPDRDAGVTEGYELGAEWFKDQQGNWQIDDKKSSYYAIVPDDARNKWPREVDFKTPYLALGELIFNTGKILLDIMGLNEQVNLNHQLINGYGRMLHYQPETDMSNPNPNWCGAHFDHSLFTGLIPAYYFQEGTEISEPNEVGLYIKPNDEHDFQKIFANDKSILLFQVGEFGQVVSNDRIKATKHLVKKAQMGIERFALAVFFSPDRNFIINSSSQLTADPRYRDNQLPDGSISYASWEKASFEQYRAK